MASKKPQVTDEAVTEEASVQTSKDSAQLLKIPAAISVQHLSELMDASAIGVIKQLMRRGVMANITQVIDFDLAATIAVDFGFQPQEEGQRKTAVGKSQTGTQAPVIEEDDPTLLKPRGAGSNHSRTRRPRQNHPSRLHSQVLGN